MKILLLLIILLSSTYARENPFVVTKDQKKNPFSNIPLINFELKKQKIAPIKEVATKNPTLDKKKLHHFTNTTHTTKVKKNIDVIDSIDTKPILFSDLDPSMIIGCCKISTKQKKKDKKRRVYKHKKTTPHSTILFKNCFLKIVSYNDQIKIYTKDRLISKRLISHPNGIELKFKSDLCIKSKDIKIYKGNIRHLNIRSHKHSYKLTFITRKRVSFKKSHGYYLIY